MKQNKDKEIRDLKWEIYDLGDDVGDWKFYTFFFGMMVGVTTFLLIFSFVDWVGLEQEHQSCQDNLGYYEGDLKPYIDFINVTCRIPKEVIEKNWIYQIYVIADNQTCKVISE